MVKTIITIGIGILGGGSLVRVITTKWINERAEHEKNTVAMIEKLSDEVAALRLADNLVVREVNERYDRQIQDIKESGIAGRESLRLDVKNDIARIDNQLVLLAKDVGSSLERSSTAKEDVIRFSSNCLARADKNTNDVHSVALKLAERSN